MHQLLENVFGKAFSNPILDTSHDSAQFTVPPGKLAMTTDSTVVRPLFFPGGDIGSMAIHGTVNDLAMSGARARSGGCAFIIEEGLPMETLWRVVCSMRDAAQRCGCKLSPAIRRWWTRARVTACSSTRRASVSSSTR